MTDSHRKIKKVAGFTLVELLITTGIMTTAGLLISTWLSRPVPIQNMMLNADMQRMADLAANEFASDLQSADPTSITWSNLPPNNPANFAQFPQFSIPQYDYNNPGSAPTQLNVQYTFKPGLNGLGSLVRTKGTTISTLLNYMLPPSAGLPLVEQDTITVNGSQLYNMLVINISYQPPAAPKPITVMRRVAVTG